MRRIAFVVLLSGSLVASVGTAAADCSGPTIEIEQSEVVRGDELLVIGSAWGDNCYDTGPPPTGEGVLGVPIDAIDIYVVQGTEEWLVATGAANDDYSFEVRIIVPAALEHGAAVVQARWNDRVAYSQDPQFVVSGPAPLVSAEPSVVTFDASTTTTAVAPTSSAYTMATDATVEVTSTSEESVSVAEGRSSGEQDEAGSSPPSPVLLVSGLVAAVAAVAAAIVVVRRRKN